MKKLGKLKPAFWDHHDRAGGHGHSELNFARKWKMIVGLTSFAALLPLFIFMLIEFNITRQAREIEFQKDVSQLAGFAAAAVSGAENPAAAALEYTGRLKEHNDIFIIDRNGVLMTPSRFLGKPGTSAAIERYLPGDEKATLKTIVQQREEIILGYARMQGTELFIAQARNKSELTGSWFKPRLKLMGYLVISIIVVLVSIMGSATYLVDRIHRADRKRSEALHQAEYANKLASIGRLASGVAHEINNPLAIISQKAGLMSDLLLLAGDNDPRLNELTEDILDAVNRCGTITRQLLDFARDMELNIQDLDIREVINQVLVFLNRETERKSIRVSIDIHDEVSKFQCDRGCLQQIFLNLFNNAIAAMDDGGNLNIQVRLKNSAAVIIKVSDTGCGISNHDIIKIFEPFFTKKEDHFSTGMGLSITYGLVQEIGGDIKVKSKVGKGTCFTLTLPLTAE
ncbi:MAG: ATP-binding protein [Desulfobacterales bacterium]|nr:ATP-binding protein [Desulfobacterales bacterium]